MNKTNESDEECWKRKRQEDTERFENIIYEWIKREEFWEAKWKRRIKKRNDKKKVVTRINKKHENYNVYWKEKK